MIELNVIKRKCNYELKFDSIEYDFDEIFYFFCCCLRYIFFINE